MNRRDTFRIFVTAPIAVLIGCAQQGGPPSPVTLDNAKIWVSSISSAVAAAAAAYTGQNAEQVKRAAAGLQTAAAAFQQITDVSTARSAALSILSLAQQIVPLVAPVLGPNAFYVSMGIAIVQAFVAALPPPPDAPALPPPDMPRLALNGVRQS